jgi:hypothetical protein
MKHALLNSKSLLLALLICAMVFPSCLKEHLHMFKDKKGGFGNAVVFVAGFESNGTNRIAKCWIDGQEVVLSDGSNDAVANSVFVAGNASYIAGNDGGPVYWKNNTEINLPINAGNGAANFVLVSGAHVYIAGRDGDNAVYWKDGTEIILNTTNANGHFPNAAAYSVFVSGNDVYVSGSHGTNAVYWKNGVEVYLTNLTPDIIGVASFQANSIDVSGGTVHVVGIDFAVGAFAPIGRYWIDGTEESGTLDGSGFLEAAVRVSNAVLVSGNTVYISGNGINIDPIFHYTPVYWKNGNLTVLPSISGDSYTSDIFVKGNDVYVSGTDKISAVYWKNGSETTLTDGTNDASATSIFVR